jgi:flavin-dependent dehydrogenase
MLVGDAGHLIDPFTGEGIGNAMYAGYYAALRAAEALRTGDGSAASLAPYEADVYRVLGPELEVSHRLQKMVRYPWLFNFLMRIGARNRELRELMTCMFNDVDLRNRFRDPRFYIRLLFNRG